MTTAERILPLLSGVRRTGDNKWVANCPAHEGERPSFACRYAEGRLLMHCFAGCTVEAICAAVGIPVSALYDNPRKTAPNPAVQRHRLALESLERWREAELQRVAEDLRARDALCLVINRMVQAGELSETANWDALADVSGL